MEKQKLYFSAEHFKKNFFLPFCAVSFMILQTVFYLEPADNALSIFAILLSFSAWLVISIYIPNVFLDFHLKSLPVKVFSVLSSLGIMLFSFNLFYNHNAASFLLKFPNTNTSFLLLFGICLSILSLGFLLFFTAFCFDYLEKLLKNTKFFSEMPVYEWAFYLVLFVLSACIMGFVFTQTNAFYNAENGYDVVYTSDSGALIRGNIFLSLYHGENDLRQPLFAVFSAPFMGIPYLLLELFECSAVFKGILLNLVQLALLLFGILLIAKGLHLSPIGRISFVIFFASTYTYMLFSLMMEQYIIAFFWLSVLFYAVCQSQETRHLPFCAATGTLLTSAATLPFLTDLSPRKDFKAWFQKLFLGGCSFLLCIVAFGRADIFLTLPKKLTGLFHFTGTSLTFHDRLLQYFAFVKSCFLAPDAYITYDNKIFPDWDFPSWKLQDVTELSLLGIGILLCAVLGFFLTRKQKSSQISLYWVGFSFAILCLLGWGTRENGLILYGLYFTWSFAALLFSLFQYIGQKTKLRFVAPVCSILAAVFMLFYNLPAMVNLIHFGMIYYPV